MVLYEDNVSLLKWIPGKAVKGQVYYAEAALGRERLTLDRVTVCGEHVYRLWKDKAHVQDFWPAHGGKLAAMSKAEEIAREHHSNQAT